MTGYTPLDSLKQCAAQADHTLEQVIKIVSTIPNCTSPMVIADAVELAVHQLSEMRALITDSVAAHAGDDTLMYSDGRDVVSKVDVGDDRPYTHVWHANPEHPYNQPRALPILELFSDGVRHQIVILAPGVITAVELPNAESS
jgi:metal-sulfur cluster biosynthetic enzyme